MTAEIPSDEASHSDDRRLQSVVDRTIPLARERIVVSKVESERIAARLSLRTHADAVTVDEDLRSEHIDVERVPVGRIVPEIPKPRSENGVTIVPVVEEVLVVQYRIVEEIRLIPRVETVRHTETVTLRRQEAHVDENPPSDDDTTKT